jgi:hypothetical protein
LLKNGTLAVKNPIIFVIESVTNIIPSAIKNMPEIIEIILICLLNFFRNFVKNPRKRLAIINGSPKPAQ